MARLGIEGKSGGKKCGERKKGNKCNEDKKKLAAKYVVK